MVKYNKVFKETILITCLIAVAVTWKIINHQFQIAPNLELVTVVSVIAALSIGFRAAAIVPIASMILSDIIIGNSSIFIYTWSAFAIIGIGALLLRKLNSKPKLQVFSSIGFVIASSFLFFVITNFGVWAQGWYPATLSGLMDSYIMAIPFYRTMLIGNLIIVPASVASIQLIKYYQNSKISVIDTLVRQ